MTGATRRFAPGKLAVDVQQQLAVVVVIDTGDMVPEVRIFYRFAGDRLDDPVDNNAELHIGAAVELELETVDRR